MKKCRLIDFQKFCLDNSALKYCIEVKYYLRATFDSVEICFLPDSILFEDKSGNCLYIHGITSIYRENDMFIVYSDYFGKEMEIKIICTR